MSNLFELLVYSSKLGRFDQWFDCFTIIFGISPTILSEEYNNLREMVQIEIEEDNFEVGNSGLILVTLNSMADKGIPFGEISAPSFTWVNEVISKKSRIGDYYKEIAKDIITLTMKLIQTNFLVRISSTQIIGKFSMILEFRMKTKFKTNFVRNLGKIRGIAI